MVICKKKIIISIFFTTLLIFCFINSGYADLTFKKLENRKVPFLDFFLLKFETTLVKRSQILRSQAFVTRIQYQNINIQIDYDKKGEKIFIEMYAVMDKNRYSKKNYAQKLSDCNQIRNLIFYQRAGYKFFTQKRDPILSKGTMEDIFKEVFLFFFKSSNVDAIKVVCVNNKNIIVNITFFIQDTDSHIAITWPSASLWSHPINILRWFFNIASFAMYTIL